jgi:hypothetical protein
MWAGTRREIEVPAVPGEHSIFGFKTAESLEISPAGQRWDLTSHHRPIIRSLPIPALVSRSEFCSLNPCVSERVRFTSESGRNVLRAAVWCKLFPEDLEIMADTLVPLLGRAMWRRLIAEGDISPKTRVVAIDVATGEHRVFDDMRPALQWADGTGKNTIYLNEYAPEAWRLFEGIGRVR